MYQYDQYDQKIVDDRVEQFRKQVKRYMDGKISDKEFLPLRLMNGLYLQRHAYMLRIAIPYGLLTSKQVRMLAYIMRRYDRGWGHFTTRQNLQENNIQIEEVPDILACLASVQMHAIQTSGNCIRNVTSDQLAGVARDELEDPRIYCEIIRQWSSFHPEFSYLPRKFKIAVSAAEHDRAAVHIHDIGLYIIKQEDEIGFQVLVGGGLGRNPVIGKVIREFLPKQHLLSYLEAILRTYNLLGIRNNLNKARIKILVKTTGIEEFQKMVETEWEQIKDTALLLDQVEIERVRGCFTYPAYEELEDALEIPDDKAFLTWWKHNTLLHKRRGYQIVYISLKHPDKPPGDCSADQMDKIADLADRYSYGEIRTTHTQNLVLADVKQADLYELWKELLQIKLAYPNIGTLTDMICCPGLDYCSLANASSIAIARQIEEKFSDLDYLYDLGDIKVKMSGCMNNCGHHSVGEIGILGVDKSGEEFYQITLGGSAERGASLGEKLGPSIPKKAMADTIENIIRVYVDNRIECERFLETYRRIGIEPFKARVYGVYG